VTDDFRRVPTTVRRADQQKLGRVRIATNEIQDGGASSLRRSGLFSTAKRFSDHSIDLGFDLIVAEDATIVNLSICLAPSALKKTEHDIYYICDPLDGAYHVVNSISVWVRTRRCAHRKPTLIVERVEHGSDTVDHQITVFL
jgi:hypothetical protein